MLRLSYPERKTKDNCFVLRNVVTKIGNDHKRSQTTTNDHKPPTNDHKPPQTTTNHQQTTTSNYQQTNRPPLHIKPKI